MYANASLLSYLHGTYACTWPPGDVEGVRGTSTPALALPAGLWRFPSERERAVLVPALQRRHRGRSRNSDLPIRPNLMDPPMARISYRTPPAATCTSITSPTLCPSNFRPNGVAGVSRSGPI